MMAFEWEQGQEVDQMVDIRSCKHRTLAISAQVEFTWASEVKGRWRRPTQAKPNGTT